MSPIWCATGLARTRACVTSGAGGGETLERLATELGLHRLTALDVSTTSLERTRTRLPAAQTVPVSILDDNALKPLAGQFDVVLVAAVLHHLVAPTRRRSLADAGHGLRNAVSLAKPDGLLVILEPVFQPRAVCSGLFWAKRAVTRFTDDRLPVFGYWNNLGAPVVSFYSADQVRRMVVTAGARIVAERIDHEPLGYADHIIRKSNLSIIAQKPGRC